MGGGGNDNSDVDGEARRTVRGLRLPELGRGQAGPCVCACATVALNLNL